MLETDKALQNMLNVSGTKMDLSPFLEYISTNNLEILNPHKTEIYRCILKLFSIFLWPTYRILLKHRLIFFFLCYLRYCQHLLCNNIMKTPFSRCTFQLHIIPYFSHYISNNIYIIFQSVTNIIHFVIIILYTL